MYESRYVFIERLKLMYENMIFCPICGIQVQQNDFTCRVCGAKLKKYVGTWHCNTSDSTFEPNCRNQDKKLLSQNSDLKSSLNSLEKRIEMLQNNQNLLMNNVHTDLKNYAKKENKVIVLLALLTGILSIICIILGYILCRVI